VTEAELDIADARADITRWAIDNGVVLENSNTASNVRRTKAAIWAGFDAGHKAAAIAGALGLDHTTVQYHRDQGRGVAPMPTDKRLDWAHRVCDVDPAQLWARSGEGNGLNRKRHLAITRLLVWSHLWHVAPTMSLPEIARATTGSGHSAVHEGLRRLERFMADEFSPISPEQRAMYAAWLKDSPRFNARAVSMGLEAVSC